MVSLFFLFFSLALSLTAPVGATSCCLAGVCCLAAPWATRWLANQTRTTCLTQILPQLLDPPADAKYTTEVFHFDTDAPSERIGGSVGAPADDTAADDTERFLERNFPESFAHGPGNLLTSKLTHPRLVTENTTRKPRKREGSQDLHMKKLTMTRAEARSTFFGEDKPGYLGALKRGRTVKAARKSREVCWRRQKCFCWHRHSLFYGGEYEFLRRANRSGQNSVLSLAKHSTLSLHGPADPQYILV